MNEREIFAAARQLSDAAERDAFLDKACAGDQELCGRIVALLEEQAQLGSFLEHDSPPARTLDQSISEAPGTIIGPYKLMEQIGEGGFGLVFVAEQHEPVRRKVALKILKPGMDTRQVIARFEAERQALAIMDHPNIAKVFDGGATPSGRPYFVMELVKGTPITQFCDEERNTPRDRLKLFVDVCAAVQHAHQKGIIHRDLKPSNVLVTSHDGKPVVKVIDFGVAKAIGGALTDKTVYTELAQLIGTPLYMSPEQAGQSGLDIDTRSDIYSLGVLLYELLTGTTPFSKERFKQAAYDEMRRIIREEEPPKPSTRLSELSDEGRTSKPSHASSLASVAAQRHTEPAKLTKLVRGELDWIVMKALEKDRNRRYETANGFAMDVQRYLADEPVQACPPSVGYRLRKFVRRNKAALVTGTLVAAALVIAVVTLAFSNAWVAQERDQKDVALQDRQKALKKAEDNEKTANVQRQKAQQNLKEALRAVDQMLTRVAEEKLANVPQMEEVRRTLLLDALKFYEKFLKNNSDDPGLRLEAGRAYRRVGEIQHHLGKSVEAEKGCKKSIELLEKLVAEYPSEPSYREALVLTYNALAATLRAMGRHEEGETAYRTALALVERLLAEDPQNDWRRHQKLELEIRLAEMASHFGRHREAEEHLKQSLPIQEELTRKLGTEYARQRLATYYSLLASVLNSTSRAREAQETWRKSLAIWTELVDALPAEPSYRHGLAWTQFLLAESLRQTGPTPDPAKIQEAERLYAEQIKLETRLTIEFPLVADYHLNLSMGYRGLAIVLASSGRNQEAEDAYRNALKAGHQAVKQGPSRPWPQHDLTETHLSFGELLKSTGRNDEAEESLKEAVALCRNLVTDFPTQADCRQRLARAFEQFANFLKQGTHFDDSEKQYREAVAVRKQLVKTSPNSATYRRELADSYSTLGIFLRDRHQPQEAAAVIREVVQLREKLIEDFPKEPEYRAQLSQWYCEWAWSLKDTEPREAEKAYRQAIDIQKKLVADYPNVMEYRSALSGRYTNNNPPGSLGEFLVRAGRFEESVAALRTGLAILDELASPGHWERRGMGHALRLLGYRLRGMGKPSEAAEVFGRAAEIFKKLAAEIQDDTHDSNFHASSLLDVGRTLAKHDPAASKRAYEEALEGFEKLIVKFPLAGSKRQFLDAARRAKTEILESLGRSAEAEDAYRQAIAEYEKLAADNPVGTGYRKAVADFCSQLGAFLSKARRHMDAETAYRKAVAVREKLADDFPHLPSHAKEAANECSVLARFLTDNRKPGEALEAWNRAGEIRRNLAENYAKNPTYRLDVGSHFEEVSEFFEKHKQPEKAKAALRDAESVCQKLASEFPNVAQYQWALGSIYRKQKDRAKALAAWSKGCELEPNNPQAWNLRGIAHAEFGESEKALADYTKCIELRPASPVAWTNRALTYLKLAKLDNALADLNKALEVQPDYWQALANRGGICLAQKEWEKAAIDYSKLVEQKPQEATYWRNLGTSRLKLGRLDEAAGDFAKVVELSPNDKRLPWSELAEAYVDQKQWDKAASYYTKAIELQPQLGPLWNNRGVAFRNLRQFDQAMTDFSKAIELNPKSQNPWTNRGDLYIQQKEWAKAADDYSRAVELNPKNAVLWTKRGSALFAMKEVNKAAADFSKAIDLTPNYVPAWFERARAYTKLGQWNNAIADYAKAAELAPKAPVLHNNVAWLLATCPDAKFRDAVRAIESGKKAVALAPKEGNYWNTLGVAYYRAANWRAAIEALEKSMELRKGGDSNDWFFLAMAHWKLDDKDKARQWYDRAAQWMDKQQPNNEELRRFRAEAAQLLKIDDKPATKP